MATRQRKRPRPMPRNISPKGRPYSCGGKIKHKKA